MRRRFWIYSWLFNAECGGKRFECYQSFLRHLPAQAPCLSLFVFSSQSRCLLLCINAFLQVVKNEHPLSMVKLKGNLVSAQKVFFSLTVFFTMPWGCLQRYFSLPSLSWPHEIEHDEFKLKVQSSILAALFSHNFSEKTKNKAKFQFAESNQNFLELFLKFLFFPKGRR